MSERNTEGLPLEPETARPRIGDEPELSYEQMRDPVENAEGYVKPIGVWYVRDRSGSTKPGEDSAKLIGAGLRGYNEGVKEGERHAWFDDVPGGSELNYAMERSFDSTSEQAQLPEIVIVDAARHGNNYSSTEPSPLAATYLEYDLKPFDEITAGVERCHNRQRWGKLGDFFDYRDLVDPVHGGDIFQDVESEVMSPVYQETYRRKREITRDMLIDCGFGRFAFGEDEDADVENVMRNIWAYMKDKNMAHLESIVTDERLQVSFDTVCKFDPDNVESDYYAIEYADPKERGGFIDVNEYKKYLRQVGAAAKRLKFEDIKEDMRKRFIALLREGVDRIAPSILAANERELRDQRIIRPVVVSVSPNRTFQRHAIEHGANMIPETLGEADVEEMIVLAGKMRASEASLAKERTERTKRDFYRAHEGELSERSMLTADTAQELEILGTIFEKEKAKEILDVGCGEGRIAVPLAGQGYAVTGIEANEVFRKKAVDGIGREGSVITGDIIDYRNAVPAEKYDAVTYTWHTILEAYGIGNTMQTLVSAWRALKPGGVLVFDQPTRENPGMEDGWYGDKESRQYLAYLMDEKELQFTLRMAGFETPEIHSWTTKPTDAYPEGMKKWTIVAKKPQVLHTAHEN